jgi:3-hydroxyacyl-CoA dehydrogenase
MESQSTNQKAPITRVAVIGAGTMGHGIAQVSAMAGYETRLMDANPEALSVAMSRITSNLNGAVSRHKATQQDADATLVRIVTASNLAAAVEDADLIIEAAAESLDVKVQIFQQLDVLAAPGAILATNTSSLSVARIAAATRSP